VKIRVDMDVCQNYGQCVFASPEVFDLDDDGELVYQEVADDAAKPDVEAAVMACPVQAISILD
jgi:ferredoxin